MQYTKYFSFKIKENGQPQLMPEQFRRMMNIIYLEGVIHGLKQAKDANKDTDQFYRYDVIIFKQEQTRARENSEGIFQIITCQSN